MKPCHILTLFLCLFVFKLYGQTPKAIDVRLSRSFEKIAYWFDNRNSDTVNMSGYDSLESANKSFARLLSQYAFNHPATISQKFPSLRKSGLTICSSSDARFRLYSWDTWTGGTMHVFENVFQYKTGDKTIAIVDTAKNGDYYTPT